jgi:hypothetical protein
MVLQVVLSPANEEQNMAPSCKWAISVEIYYIIKMQVQVSRNV